MPLPSSTLPERIRRIQGDLNTRLPGADAGITRTAEYALGQAQAGAIHGQQGHSEWVGQNAVPGPDSDETTLERWLDMLGIPRKAAEHSTGPIRIFGDDLTAVPAGTEFQLADGTVVDTDGAETIIDQGGSYYVDADVTAVEAGTEGNAADGTIVRLVSPVAGVDTEATVDAADTQGGLTGGTDLETVAEMWTRVQQRMSFPPGAGTETDYERWTLEVSGVTRAWATGQALGAGTVRIFFVRDNDADIIPDGAAIADVQTYVDTKRPVTANVTVGTLTGETLNYTIANISDATAQANIDASLADYLLRAAEPGGTIPLEELIGAIDLAVGSSGFELTSPSADVTHTATQLPVHGTISW